MVKSTDFHKNFKWSFYWKTFLKLCFKQLNYLGRCHLNSSILAKHSCHCYQSKIRLYHGQKRKPPLKFCHLPLSGLCRSTGTLQFHWRLHWRSSVSCRKVLIHCSQWWRSVCWLEVSSTSGAGDLCQATGYKSINDRFLHNQHDIWINGWREVSELTCR